MQRANDWTAGRFKSCGLAVGLEPYSSGIPWEHGEVSLRLIAVSPGSHRLSWAWTEGTGGKTLSGPVVATSGRL
jgi:hypothetical protein